MAIQLIRESEITPLAVASLPGRPNATPEFGGRGYTPKELKEAFDKLPRLAIARLNGIIESILSGDVVNDIPMESGEGTLGDFLIELQTLCAQWEETLQAVNPFLTQDDTPTEGSQNPVTSDGIYVALQSLAALCQSERERLNAAITTLCGIHLICRSDTYQISLVDGEGNLLGGEVDLPLESVVMGGNYDAEAQSLVLTLNNGQEVAIPVEQLVEGLVDAGTLTAAIEEIGALLEAYATKEALDSVIQTAEMLLGDVTELEERASFTETRMDRVENEDIPQLEEAVEQAKRESAIAVAALMGTALLSKTTIEDTYSMRETAGGLDIIDGVQTTVKRIEGDTVSSMNLLPNIFKKRIENGVTYTANADGTVTAVCSLSTSASYVQWSIPDGVLVSGRTYTLSGCPVNTLTGNDRHGIWVEYTNALGENIAQKDYGGGVTFTVEVGACNFQLIINVNMDEGTLVFKPMLVEGSEAKPFVPYFNGLKNANFKGIESRGTDEQEDISFTLATPVELGKWDYMDVARRKVVRQTRTLVFDGTEIWGLESINSWGFANFQHQLYEENSAVGRSVDAVCTVYDITPTAIVNADRRGLCVSKNLDHTNLYFRESGITTVEAWKAHLARLHANGTPLIVSYKTDVILSEEDIDIPDGYTAWDGGTETIMQGETDNSAYGAVLTVTQEYYTLVGGSNA